MDMAYNFEQHTTPASTTNWIRSWATQQFGAYIADATVDILNRYGTLTARRKYELLSETPFAFSTINYDEAQNNLAQWEDLMNKAQITYNLLDQAIQTSFFQLVLHPIMAGKTMVDLYTKVAMNKLYAEQGRVSTNFAAEQAQGLYRQDAEITMRYNSLNNGKWDGFVNQQHIGYTSWQEPSGNIMPVLTYISSDSALPGSLGIGIQGSSVSYPRTKNLTLLPMSSHMPELEVRSFDLFALTNGTIPYTISTNSSYIAFSSNSGSLRSPGNQADKRIVITIDWPKVPTGESTTFFTVSSGSDTTTLRLPLQKINLPASFKGHVESNGVIAIEASHFTSSGSADGISYVEIPNYGRTLSAVKPWPITMKSQSASMSPALSYNIFTTTAAPKAKIVFMMSASHNHDPTRPLKFAWSVNGSKAKEVLYALANPVYKESPAWRKAVVENGWTAEVTVEGGMKAGMHEIKVWLLEPGVVLQRIVLDVGGLKPSALGPLESRRV